MLERSHWWLAAAAILIGTMVPFAVNETFGIEPDAGFVFFISYSSYGAPSPPPSSPLDMASGLRPRRLLGTTKRANADDPEHPGRASASAWSARTDSPTA